MLCCYTACKSSRHSWCAPHFDLRQSAANAGRMIGRPGGATDWVLLPQRFSRFRPPSPTFRKGEKGPTAPYDLSARCVNA